MELLLMNLRYYTINPTFALVAVSVLVAAVIHKLAWRAPISVANLLQKQGVPVLPYRVPLVGNALEIARLQKSAESSCLPLHHSFLHRILPLYTKYSPSYGKSFVYWWGRQPTLIVTSADDLKDILSTHSKQYHKSPMMPVLVHRMFGHGILSVEGEEWENQRRILNPAFFVDKIKGMVSDMYTSAIEMANRWESMLEKASLSHGALEVEVAEAFKTLTADILARTCFGTCYQQGKAAFEDQSSLLKLTWKDNVWHLLIPGYRYFPTPTNIQSWRLQKSMVKNLREIVESRLRYAVKEGAGSKTSYGEDLLGLILAANNDIINGSQGIDHIDDGTKPLVRLSTAQIIDECKAFFFAGHETTASLLAWTMMLLAQHPDWQHKARSEVLQVCGNRSQVITADHLGKLKVVGLVLNESMRLYPPVPQLLARTHHHDDAKSCTWKGHRLLLPEGLRFTAMPVVLHRDPSLWGEDAELFKPQRFADGASKACKHPNGFAPFGLGPHTCIGQTFATTEAKLIMAVILQRFRFTLSPTYQHAPRSLLTLSPQFGIPLLLEKVSSSTT